MTSIDELVALLYGASRRMGALSAELHIWPRGVEGPPSPAGIRWRVVQDGARYRWELVRQSPGTRRQAARQPSLLVGDGERAWAQHADRVVIRPYQGCLLADPMLDVTWLLAGFDLTVTGRSELNGRPIVHIEGERKQLRRGLAHPAEAIEAVVDAERGFLHRLSNVEGGEKFEVLELSDLHLDIAVDDSAFSLVLPSRHRVEDRTQARHGHLLHRRARFRRAQRV